ncbi:MAG TPA: tetratricopeptide repeat protein [Pilimelia sp.]|nr:tetratricopeptide repeat protein [Pilimelia sp.]
MVTVAEGAVPNGHPASPRSLGAELRRIRVTRGLSQREVVRRLGLSAHSNLVDYELGRRIPPSDIVAACEALFDVPCGSLERLRGAALAARAAPLSDSRRRPSRTERPRQLPAAMAHFTDRAEHLERLDAFLAGPGAGPLAVVVAVLTGTAGVGKTALAVEWAHRVAHRFPDGQLYVNLRGFDPAGAPMTAAEALRGFLDGLGVAAARVPATVAAQAGLYRSLLAGRRVLIVLDNARDADQVRPLLPGAPGCVVVVTSRDRLSGLVAVEGAHPLTVAPFAPATARSALAARLGRHRVAAEPRAVDDMVDRCAGLPLAVAIVAARAAAHPNFALATFVRELRDTPSTLDGLAGPEALADVRTVFSWSYRTLSDSAARLFRQLALHPGPDVALPAAASLASAPPGRTREWLAELTDASLLTEHAPGRYTLHDLLRAYAAEQAHALDSPAEREATVDRVLDHYLHTANAAALLRDPHRDQIPLPPAAPGVTPEPITDSTHALSWLATEHQVLLAAVRLAGQAASGTRTWQLAWAVAGYLDRQGHWSDLLDTQRTALRAARRIADRTGQAQAHRHLGNAYLRMGRLDDAHRQYSNALDLFGQLGDDVSTAHVHVAVNVILDGQGRHEDALAQVHKALDLFRATGHRAGNAFAMNAIGWLHATLGDHRQAIIWCQRSLAVQQELGDRYAAAGTWDSLGYAHHHLGHHAEAHACYQRALDLLRQTRDRYHTAVTLGHVGDNHRAAGDHDPAQRAWQQALAILDELDHPDADTVRAKLGRTAGPR